jgi:hypothetical protein
LFLEQLACHKKKFLERRDDWLLGHSHIQLLRVELRISDAQKRENPVISDWVRISGGSTEGLLGRWLAQRQAALREVMAAGALSTFTLGLPCVPVVSRAASVPRKKLFGIRKEFNLVTRSVSEMAVVHLELIAKFDQREVILESNDPYSRMR